jgi:hypothetical protein
MKRLASLLIFACSAAFGSEMTWKDLPEVDDPAQVSLFTAGGMKASAKTTKRVYSRDGVRVAELVTTVITVGDKTTTGTSIRFFIDEENWVSVSVDEYRTYRSWTKIEVAVLGSTGSVTIVAPGRKYCEKFSLSDRKFWDDETRDLNAPIFFEDFAKFGTP